MQIQFTQTSNGSIPYLQSLALRHEVLREPLDMQFTAQEIAEENTQIHIIGMANDLVVASNSIINMPNNVAKIRQVAVLPAFQGQGIGHKLSIFTQQYLKENGVFSLILHARMTAVPFYQSLGYSISGYQFYEVGIAHYKMLKTL